MKVTSADCKKWIVENGSPDTKASDWKRRKKYKQGDATVRVFDNDVAGESVGVVEVNGEIVGTQEEQGHIPTKPTGNGVLAKLRDNLIKVDFSALDFSDPDLSGRVVYEFSEEVGDEEDEDDERMVMFFCGPETKRGYLDDGEHGGCYDLLEKLFADLPPQMLGSQSFPGVTTGEAENMHSVAFIDGISASDLWALVEERLVRSGAVKMKAR